MKMSEILAPRTVLFASTIGLVILAAACAASPSGKNSSLAMPRANLDAGIQALEAREFEKAVQQLEIAIVADPKNPDGYFRLGQSHRGLGDFQRALKYIRLALEIEPNHLPALQERGETLLDQGKPDEARETLEQLGAKCDQNCSEYQSLKQLVDRFPAKSGGG